MDSHGLFSAGEPSWGDRQIPGRFGPRAPQVRTRSNVQHCLYLCLALRSFLGTTRCDICGCSDVLKTLCICPLRNCFTKYDFHECGFLTEVKRSIGNLPNCPGFAGSTFTLVDCFVGWRLSTLGLTVWRPDSLVWVVFQRAPLDLPMSLF